MTSEDDLHSTKEVEVEIVDIISEDLTAQIKAQRDEINQLYAKLIANPYLAPQLIPDFRGTLMSTLAILMENGIPVSENPKLRTPEDVIKEGLAELGTMLGATGIAAALRMKKTFSDTVKSKTGEEFVVYRDPETNTFYFINPETNEEIDCDEEGNPLE